MELEIVTSSSTASPFTSVSFFVGGFLPQHLKIGISHETFLRVYCLEVCSLVCFVYLRIVMA